MHSDKLTPANSQRKVSDYSFTRVNATGETYPATIKAIEMTPKGGTIRYNLHGRKTQKTLTFNYADKKFTGKPTRPSINSELRSLITTHLRTLRKESASPNNFTAFLENVLLWW